MRERDLSVEEVRLHLKKVFKKDLVDRWCSIDVNDSYLHIGFFIDKISNQIILDMIKDISDYFNSDHEKDIEFDFTNFKKTALFYVIIKNISKEKMKEFWKLEQK
jgi:hypothetical protein